MVVWPLRAEWCLVDGRPLYHRRHDPSDPDAPAIVHVHGFGISGRYLEPTAALLADRYRTFVPDLPGAGRSLRPERPLDIPGFADALLAYCDVMGVERATFVGNSLGCPIIIELAHRHPDRVSRAVLVSPAGGPANQPLVRALSQMIADSWREPLAMLPIAVRDYLRFGVLQSLHLFAAMTRYPTVDRVMQLHTPTTVVIGRRDPLVRAERVTTIAARLGVDVARVPGAHALNFSQPAILAALVHAAIEGAPLDASTGPLADVEVLVRSR